MFKWDEFEKDNTAIADYLFTNDSKEIKQYHLQNVQFGTCKVKNMKGEEEEAKGLLITLHTKLCNVVNTVNDTDYEITITDLFFKEPSISHRTDLQTLGNYIAQLADSGEKLAISSMLNGVSNNTLSYLQEQVKVAENAADVNNEEMSADIIYKQTDTKQIEQEYNYRIHVFQVFYSTFGKHRNVIDFTTGSSSLIALEEFFNNFVLSNNLFYVKDENDEIGNNTYVNANKYLTEVDERFKPLYNILKDGFRGLHFELQLEILSWYSAFFFLLLENRSIIDVVKLSKMAITLEELRNVAYKEQIRRVEVMSSMQQEN